MIKKNFLSVELLEIKILTDIFKITFASMNELVNINSKLIIQNCIHYLSSQKKI